MANFKDLQIWQKGMLIANQTYDLVKLLPVEEIYAIRPQLIRAAISIPSNIAEGSGRNSQKEFKRFVEYSQGSCYELETQVLIIKNNFKLDKFDFSTLLSEIQEDQKMINEFSKRLESNI